MQINRLFEIVYMLLNKKSVTAKELSEHFEISQRTVYRDIETLCQAGIPVCTSKGKGGGISLPDNFILNKSVLSEVEQVEILSALKGLNAAHYPEIDDVVSKLNSLFGINNPDWIEVDFSDWGDTQKEKFIMIKTSIIERRMIHFDYYGSYGEKTFRIVKPLQLWFKGNRWYLKALCCEKDVFRIFKLTRIKNLTITDETFKPILLSEEKGYEVDTKQENMVTLKLKIDESQAYRVYDEFDEKQIFKNEDNSFTVTATYPESEWVYGYILSFGCFAEVLEPLHIREIIVGKLEKSLNIYS